MAKRKRRQPKVWTSDKILNDWKKAVKKGLGSKRLDPSIEAQFKAPLLAKIQSRLDPPQSRDYNVEGPSTRAVATTLGRICRLITTENNTVNLAVFEQAFKLCRLHPKCPTGGPGSGQWCNI
jgi:hypothetical protein